MLTYFRGTKLTPIFSPCVCRISRKTAQASNLNLANSSRVRPPFDHHLPGVAASYPQQTESTCQHFTLFGVQPEQPFDDAWCISSSLRRVSSGPFSLFHRPGCPQQRFSESPPAGVYRGNALVKTKHTADVINWAYPVALRSLPHLVRGPAYGQLLHVGSQANVQLPFTM